MSHIAPRATLPFIGEPIARFSPSETPRETLNHQRLGYGPVNTPSIGIAQKVLRTSGILFILLGLLSMTMPAFAQTSGGDVRVVEVQGTIDLGLAPFIDRAISEAEEDGATAVLLDINTPGGRLDATFQIRDSLLGADVPTIAFINGDAFSAGALISLAAEHIYMTPGSSIGSATPVDGTGQTADEKNVSAVRSTFRSTAEARGRDPEIAQGMVDPRIEIEGLVDDETLVSMTTSEALEFGISDGTVDDFEEALEAIGITDADLQQVEQSWAETFVRFITEPVIASLLFSLGSLLIIVDIFSGELSPLSGIGAGGLVLFFGGHYIAGLAGWEGVLLVVLGLALIAIELFIIPGFGIFGILGILSLAGGLFVSLIGDVAIESDLRRAGYTVAGAVVMVLFGIVMMLVFLPSMGRFRGLVLQTTVGRDDPIPPEPGYRRWFRTEDEAEPADVVKQTETEASLAGLQGRALSDLRPGGFARIDGKRVDVVTQGDYIREGDLIEVVADDRYRRVVKLVEAREEPEPDEDDED
ncbi:MAG: nodulation protein NfeD [Sphaerobacteraceae bacterium]|nr:MAG: nodulation protein NfeD [Sphaerobacteraceae bacterium]